MNAIIEGAMTHASTAAELTWLRLQIWALHAEMQGLQLLAWLAANPDGATGTACGMAGAFVLATSARRESLGWLLFLASNAGMIALGMRLQRPDIVLLQAVFTVTSLLGLWRTAVKPRLHWDDWRGDFAGNPTMYIKRLASFRGRCLDLHKMVAPDMPGCFHTHPARAIRFILWGGYTEELEAPHGQPRAFAWWLPCYIGVVTPNLSHRIEYLPRGVSYSLWLRGRKTHKTQLRGAGWTAEDLAQNEN